MPSGCNNRGCNHVCKNLVCLILYLVPSAGEHLLSSAETPPARWWRLITAERSLATATSPALLRPLVSQPEDSVPAGGMSSVDGAQSAPRDTTASPTADVSGS